MYSMNYSTFRMWTAQGWYRHRNRIRPGITRNGCGRKRRSAGADYNIKNKKSNFNNYNYAEWRWFKRSCQSHGLYASYQFFLFLAIHIYWFYYGWLHKMGWTLDIVDKILSNFQCTTGLFSFLFYTKLFCVLFLGLSCMGNEGVKKHEITWRQIIIATIAGTTLFPKLVVAVHWRISWCMCGTLTTTLVRVLKKFLWCNLWRWVIRTPIRKQIQTLNSQRVKTSPKKLFQCPHIG